MAGNCWARVCDCGKSNLRFPPTLSPLCHILCSKIVSKKSTLNKWILSKRWNRVLGMILKCISWWGYSPGEFRECWVPLHDYHFHVYSVPERQYLLAPPPLLGSNLFNHLQWIIITSYLKPCRCMQITCIREKYFLNRITNVK